MSPSGRGSSRPRPAAQQQRRSALSRFVRHYGWRAYAIPVLVALTVLIILQAVQDNHRPTATSVGSSSSAGAPSTGIQTTGTVINGAPVTTMPAPATASTASGGAGSASGGAAAAGAGAAAAGVGGVGAGAGTAAASVVTAGGAGTAPAGAGTASVTAAAGSTPTGNSAPDPNSGAFQNVAAGNLPPGGAFVAKGKGTWHLVPGTTAPIGSGPDKFTYTITVEDGVEPVAADQQFATAVIATLQDPRSWVGSGNYTFQRISSGTPNFTVSLTSQMTERADALCGWDIHMEASCYARDQKRVSINDARWTRGAVSYSGDLQQYRIYAINHEVGHALGFMHQPCKVNGGPAPVMMQQSWSVADNDLAPLSGGLVPQDGKACKPNPYPFPRGPKSAGNTDSPDNPGTGPVAKAAATTSSH